MSGTRDFKELVSRDGLGRLQFSRSEGDLLAGYLTGSRRRKGYATVDYDRLLSQAATEKRFAQQQSLHIRQLASKGRESRRQWQLRQHREAWHRERAKITRQISQCQHELRSWRAACLRDDVGGLRPLMEELFQLECDMAQERAEFAHQITSPVRDIRSETEALSRRAPGSPPISQESIGHFIQEVTEQLIHIGQILEEEVKIMSECEEVWSKEEPDEHRPLSVPVELQALPCPSAKLKSMMGDECIALDYFFQQQLQELKRPQKASCMEDEWSEEDRIRFSLIFDQYPPGSAHYRQLLMDRLGRELSHKTRREIVAHEDCYRAELHRCSQQRMVQDEWSRARAVLLAQCREACAEAMRQWYHRRALRLEREEQQGLCNQLHRRVRQWREDCQLRQQEANRQAKLLLDKQVAAVRNEWERERERREGIKEELQANFAMRVRQQEEEVLQHRRMVWEQQSCLAKQTARNSERVEYRSSLMEVRKQEQTDRQERKYQERQKMEEHLEQLRSIVRKEASSDLDRTCGDTEASWARAQARHGNESEPQQPLFPLHGFLDDKITSDKRFRVEAALRQAGLLSSEYAHQVLADVQPPNQHRRDQNSSLFK